MRARARPRCRGAGAYPSSSRSPGLLHGPTVPPGRAPHRLGHVPAPIRRPARPGAPGSPARTGTGRTSAPRQIRPRRPGEPHRGPAWTAEQLDLAGVRRHQAEQNPQQRCLAGAVGAEQPAHLAGRDDQVDAVHGTRRLEPLESPLARTAATASIYGEASDLIRRVSTKRGSAPSRPGFRPLPAGPQALGDPDGRHPEVRQRPGRQPGRADGVLRVLLDLPPAARVHHDPRLRAPGGHRSTTRSRTGCWPSFRSSATSCTPAR